MKSVFVKELEELAVRLGEDGYPTALIERAAERMQQLEEEVVRLHIELSIEKNKEILKRLSD